MPHDQALEKRISKVLLDTRQIKIKKMFGGIVFMHRGNMLCGNDKSRLMVRAGPDHFNAVIKLKNAMPMDITGRPMKGFIFVYPIGLKTTAELKKWIQLGLNFTNTLKAKK